MAKSLTYGQGPYMPLLFLVWDQAVSWSETKQILQVEVETFLVWDQANSWSRTKQFLQVHSWSVNQVDLGQVDQADDV